jgi:glycosyltransferase involved in cell wall biosynthesis
VVFASTYEGFGMPIVEANATGRPVVTSNIGPMPEVAGSAACLVDPFDCSSIREGIVRVIGDADYRSHLVAGGFENVKRFQADVIAAQYAAVYREVFLRR